jgi:putative spermidine/putrescine transport system permease protein
MFYSASRWLLWLTTALSALFLMAPLIVIIGASFSQSAYLKFPPQGFTLRWYDAFWNDASYLQSIGFSAVLAVSATALSLVAAVPAAFVLARHRFLGSSAISAAILSPMILPLIVIGAALLQFAGAVGLARTATVLILGHALIIMPYIVRTTLASLTGFDKHLEEASLDLGANGFSTFFHVTLPIIKPGVMAGGIFAIVMSWINVELSMFHTAPGMMPIPVKLFNYIQYSVDPSIAAVSAGTIYLAIVIAVVVDMTIGLDRVAVTR